MKNVLTKVLIMALAIFMMASVLVSCGETSQETESRQEQEDEGTKGLEYVLNADGESYSVSGTGIAKDKDIVIPRTYGGYPVTGIKSGAFSYAVNFDSVFIPSSVTTIANRAFSFNSELTIRAEVESQPSGWDSDWNSSNCPVVWGYTG